MRTTYSAKVLAGLAVLSTVGFWKSFYFASADVRSEYPWILYAHGLTLLGWGLLATLQAQLVGSQKLKLHRGLGWASIALVAAAVASTVAVVRWSVAGNLEAAPRENVLAFTLVQTTDLLTFVGYFVAAIVSRRRKAEHLSWIFCATVALLAPSLVRAKVRWLEFVPLSPLTFAMGCADLILLALWFQADAKARGSRRVFATSLAIALAIQLLRPWASHTPAWLHLAEKLFV